MNSSRSSDNSLTVRFIPEDGAGVDDLVAIVQAALAVPEVAQHFSLSGYGTVNSLLEKAIVIDAEGEARALEQATAGIEEITARLMELKDGWQATCELHAAATRAAGPAWANPRLEKARRVFERQARSVIRTSLRQMWMRGREAGGATGPLRHDEEVQLQRLYREEQQYFLNLLVDVEQGTGRMDKDRRVAMYGRASLEAYWAGFVLAQLAPGRYVQWIKNDVESCGDCILLARGGRWGNGIYTARELARAGLFPRSGKLQCCTNCECELRAVPRPTGPPVRGHVLLSDLPLKGVSSSSFTGQGRSGRQALEKRAAKYGRWTHQGRTVKRGNPLWRAGRKKV